MKKSLLLIACGLLLSWLSPCAQVTSEPSPLQEDSQDVVIYYHADEGNRGLAGLPASTQIYAHTGVITNNSTSGSDWKYAPTWGDNDPKYLLEYVSPDLWKLNIGDLRTYYGITDPAERIEKLAFVFRTADNSKEGKGEGNTDIFLDVYASGLQVAIETSLSGSIITPSTADVHFKVGATKAADLTLSINGTTIASAEATTLLEADYTFTEPGNYEVVATADAGSEHAETTLPLSYLAESPEAQYPGGEPKMGTVWADDGSVIFCLAAPEKSSVSLVGSWNGYEVSNSQLMNYTMADGFKYFWIAIPGLKPDQTYLYYYVVDGTIKVGDPYARLVLDPDNDKYIPESVYPNLPAYPYDKVDRVPLAVLQKNLNDYAWQVADFQRPDKSNLIIYELLIRDFTGTEGKALGDGTVKGAIEKIPYLKGLGVNAVELLPINEFNGNISWGYNPNFYFAPDKAYGTPDDYKEFIDVCHQNGIAVILDMVFNQSDWQHPWYQMYPEGSNPFYNATAPHAYSVLNDWNQGYGLVQKQWHDVIRYWVEEYKVDGYRFDLVKGLGDNDSYANPGDDATNAYNASRVARMKELQDVLNSVSENAYFINENLAGSKEENEMAETGQLNWANVNHQGSQFAIGSSSDSNLSRFYAPLDGSRLWGSTVSYLESHDEQRLAYRQNIDGVTGVRGNLDVSMARLGSAAAQMLMAPGAHMIWQFSELGNYDNTKNSNGGNNTDPKTVRWSLLDSKARKGLHDSYAQLIGIRTANPELFAETAEFSSKCTSSDWADGRTLVAKANGKEIITVVNPNITGSIEVSVPFSSKNDADYQILASTYNTTPTFSAAYSTVTVEANSFVVIGSAGLTGVEEITADNAASLRCSAVAGAIQIETQGRYDIYNVNGSHVATGSGNATVSVAPGLYIVNSANRSLKVIVK